MSAPLTSTTSSAPSGWTTSEKIVGVAITVLTLAISATASFATANSQLAQKVDRTEYQRDAAETDRRITRDSIERVIDREQLRHVEIGVDSANLRLRQIWCEGKGPSCR